MINPKEKKTRKIEYLIDSDFDEADTSCTVSNNTHPRDESWDDEEGYVFNNEP